MWPTQLQGRLGYGVCEDGYKNQGSVTKEESGSGSWVGFEPSLPQKVTGKLNVKKSKQEYKTHLDILLAQALGLRSALTVKQGDKSVFSNIKDMRCKRDFSVSRELETAFSLCASRLLSLLCPKR